MKINKEISLPEGNVFGRTGTISEERITKVLEFFSIKEGKSIQIRTSPAPLVDPSL